MLKKWQIKEIRAKMAHKKCKTLRTLCNLIQYPQLVKETFTTTVYYSEKCSRLRFADIQFPFMYRSSTYCNTLCKSIKTIPPPPSSSPTRRQGLTARRVAPTRQHLGPLSLPGGKHNTKVAAWNWMIKHHLTRGPWEPKQISTHVW